MKFLLPKDLQKFRYYTMMLEQIHGTIELKRIAFTNKWSGKNKHKIIDKVKQFEK